MNGNPRLVGPVSVISDCMSTYNDTCFYKGRWCLPLSIWLHGCTSTVCLTKKYSIGQKAHQGKHENLSLDIHLSSVFGVYLDIICPKGDFPTVLGWNQFYLRVKHPENESKTVEKEDAFSLPIFFRWFFHLTNQPSWPFFFQLEPSQRTSMSSKPLQWSCRSLKKSASREF